MAKKVSRPKLVKDWDKMPKEIVAAIKAEYPNGFSHKLITYTTPKGEKVLALPYDTEAIDYLVRVTIMESKNIQKGDDDDDEDVAAVVKAPREDLDLDGLDIDGLKQEDDSFSSGDDDDDEYIPPSRRRRQNDDDDDGDDDY
jgi:DNA-directed RNA polymerase subunit delta